ncbi:MAG: nuclear transport factor 2 family protein [Chitinophagaceae bacterium]
MLSREVLDSVIKAYDDNDVKAVTESFHENGEWDMVGQFHLKGIKEIGDFFKKSGEMVMLDSTKDHILIEGNTAVVDGQVKCRDASGTVTEMRYCDIYEFEGEKVRALRSYVITKK